MNFPTGLTSSAERSNANATGAPRGPRNENNHMRMCVVWGGVCLALALLTGGCSNSDNLDMEKLPPMEVEGLPVDAPQLSVSFQKSSPELFSKVSDAVTKLRYKQYVDALAGLDAVLNTPGVTEKQKKLLNQVIGQIKQVIAKNPGY